MCGIALNMPIDGNSFANKHFLRSVTCVSDILQGLDYAQIYFSGIKADFTGTKFFFESHGVEVRDLAYFQAQNLLPKKLPKELKGFWDLKDAKMFELVKEYLSGLDENKPFALYISTIDTHAPRGFVDATRCQGGASYQSAISCADKIIADFVNFVQKSKFKDNTTIIILGDHLSMAQVFPPQANRAVFNTFINAKFTRPATTHAVKNRILSHFDIAPLILDSVGVKTPAFGLGRNPLYQPTLLESTFSLEEFNEKLSQRNRLYDSFWNVK